MSMSTSSVDAVWESVDMPILDEALLSQHGDLTVSQFLQHLCDAQCALVRRHAASLVEELKEKAGAAEQRLTSSAQTH